MRFTLPRFLPALAAVTLVAAAATAAPDPARAAQHAVDITDFAFAPGVITVSVGDTVTWTNGDDAPHTVTSVDGAFDSGRLDPGDSWSMKVTQAGTFEYRCDFHSEMRGTLVVRDAKGGAQSGEVAAGSAGGHSNHAGGGKSDQPDTAVDAPWGIGLGNLSPAALMGVGLVVIALSIFRRPRRVVAAVSRPIGGWRR